MNALRILALCVTAALICAVLRSMHPQMASMVAMGAGAAAILLSKSDIQLFAEAIQTLDAMTSQSGESLIKICGIVIVAEFASDICREAGEALLAKRIDMGVRIGVVASAIPTVGGILLSISGMLQ